MAAKKSVRHSVEKHSKVNPHTIAKGLGADSMIPLNGKGLLIVFIKNLYKIGDGVSPGGAVFPFEILDGYDVAQGMIFLAKDYEVWQKFGSDVFVFRSSAKGRPEMFVHKKKIFYIWDLSKNSVLYAG